jgi:hypothetical protein
MALGNLMVLLCSVCKWKFVSVCLEIVLVSVHDRCIVCAKRTIGSEIILTHPMEVLGDVGQVEAHFGLF